MAKKKKEYFVLPSPFQRDKKVIIDLDDILDVVPTNINSLYVIVFPDGIQWQAQLNPEDIKKFDERRVKKEEVDKHENS